MDFGKILIEQVCIGIDPKSFGSHFGTSGLRDFGNPGTPKWERRKSDSYRKFNHRQQRRKGKDKFKKRFDDSFHRQSTTHHHQKLGQFQEAIFNGDLHSAFASFNKGQSHVTHANSYGRHRHARRLAANRARRLSKNEQCDLLATCVSRMTLYDFFVYFFSDDIDPANGEIDQNIIKFDEQDLVKKYRNAHPLALAIRDGGSDKFQHCDKLLSQFHRTIEHGDVPEWRVKGL